MNNDKKSIRILMVDDEIDFLESSTRALVRRGFEVLHALDGLTALQMVGEEVFDVVVLDLKMPGIDGEEVFRRIRESRPDLPVIMLTGHGSVPHAFETAKKGIADYIAKPCDMDELEGRIHKVLEIKRDRSGQTMSQDVPGEKIHVLIIDDDDGILKSLRSVLEHRHMEVSTARTPSTAFRILKESMIDVVLLDVRLPEMDGMEVLKHIKRSYPSIEVLLLTGYPSVDTALEGVNQGSYAYITKPADPDELAAKIRRANEARQESIRREQQKIVDEMTRKYPE
jgi:DNA-binding NtrC family response regulator